MKTPPEVGLAFLVSQLGWHTALEFGRRLERLGLTPQHVGVLRLLACDPLAVTSQAAIGRRLGVLPSRLVVLLDELGDRGLVVRRANPGDRRSKRVQLTPAGREAFAEVEALTAELEGELFSALTPEQRAQLHALTRALADHLGLAPGVHPAYRAGGQEDG
ncbi:MAG: MarR family transcriptional regulator [Alphaproteobacteria bacterium]|nr:MarR family transcriptional regulator [Alphaproteobacteria bacterium]MCB9796102.1 MarR family transcriptional regulator [Alphaproteobacteria bacterium]